MVRNSRLLIAVTSAVISGMWGLSNQAMAQEASARQGVLEEIVVTARRREESLMETPVSVTAFTRAELAARQIDRAYQIAEATPNLTFRNTNGESNIANVVYIRGIGQRDFIPTVQPGVGLYVDGVYMAGLIGAVSDLVDIQSIEVLRGPQGTLFGRNTIGGAILINSVKPSDEFSADAQLTFGDFSRREIKGSVNVPFSDSFFGKFSALRREKDGYIDTLNIPGDDGFGSDDTSAARIALRWIPADSLTIDLAGDISHIESDGVPRVFGSMIDESADNTPVGEYNNAVAPALGLPLFTNANVWLPRDSYATNASYHVRAEADIWSLSLTVSWNFGDLTLKSISNYRDSETFDGADGDNSPLLVNINDDLMDGDQFTHEFQLSGVARDGRLEWLTGLYYFQNDVVNLNPVHFPFFSLMSGSIVANKSSAIFGQLTHDFTDKWSLTLGARYTDEKLDSIVDDRHQFVTSLFDPTCTGSCAGPVPGANGPRPGVDGYRPLPVPPDPNAFRVQPNNVFESDETQFEPYVNVAYNFADNMMGYFSYSEGFKGGGFTQRIPPGRVVESFGPEFAKVYEIGAKWSGLEDRLRLTGAAFLTDYTDLQVAVTRELGGSIENAGDAEIKGFELELHAVVTPRFQVSAGLGYMDGKYTELDPAATIPIGNRLPSIMDWQRNASVVYRTPLSSGQLIARVDYSYVDDHFTERDNTISHFVPSYSLVNAALAFVHESDRWEIAVQGRNITDELYHTNSFLDLERQGYITHVLGPPAEYSARIQYRF